MRPRQYLGMRQRRRHRAPGPGTRPPTLTITARGGKVVTIPLAPHRPRDRPGYRRTQQRSCLCDAYGAGPGSPRKPAHTLRAPCPADARDRIRTAAGRHRLMSDRAVIRAGLSDARFPRLRKSPGSDGPPRASPGLPASPGRSGAGRAAGRLVHDSSMVVLYAARHRLFDGPARLREGSSAWRAGWTGSPGALSRSGYVFRRAAFRPARAGRPDWWSARRPAGP